MYFNSTNERFNLIEKKFNSNTLKSNYFNYIQDDSTILEQDPLENAALKNQLMAYKHEGFWQCMDTKRDKDLLEDLWQQKKAPWLI